MSDAGASMRLRVVASEAASAAAWDQGALPRERRDFLRPLAFGVIAFPAYHIVDRMLEPGHLLPFVVMRVIGTLLFIAGLVIVRRTHSLILMRAVFAIVISATGAMVASTMVIGTHPTVMMFGYSVYVWAFGLVPLPPRLMRRMLAWQLAVSTVTLALLSGHEDTITSAFFIALSAGFALMSSAARYRSDRLTFDAAHQLGVRNRELEATMVALCDAQARLIAQEKQGALNRVLSGVSHEINNPVNIIKNNIEPMREHVIELLAAVRLARTGTPESLAQLKRAWDERDLPWRAQDLNDALDELHTAVAHIRRVHTDLRAYIRGEMPAMVAADVNDGLRAAAAQIAERVPKDVVLELELAPLLAIACQPGQLNQVWMHLVENAIDAVGPAGRVTISSRERGDHVEITVTDSGPGVASGFRARLFEPFATTKDPGSRAGLGLATSYQIVQRHGGRMYLDEEHAGGARFAVELPRVQNLS